MVPLVDEAQVEACFGSIEHSANLDARLVHGLRRTYHRLGDYFGHKYHRLGDYFGRTRWNSKVTWVM